MFVVDEFIKIFQFDQTLKNVQREKVSKMTKNLSKTFKNKVNGQRLPPLPVANELSNSQNEQITSILKKPRTNRDKEILSDDDEIDSSRISFCKTQADVLLLLDTFPPKTWTAPRSLQANQDLILNQARLFDPNISVVINPDSDLTDKFPAPLSDRLPSSRYCRRSLSSACSRRSSILFARQNTTNPVDATTIQRENTSDTLCESPAESFRQAYAPLPPISNETQSVLSKSLLLEQNDTKLSISPPLITSEQSSAVQQKKENYTQLLLARSRQRESSALVKEKPVMESPIIVQKTTLSRPILTTRPQQSIIDRTRFSSIERTSGPLSNRSKPSTTSQVRSSKVSFDNSQSTTKVTPSSQLTTSRTYSNVIKPKTSSKPMPAKSKIQETNPTLSTNDVTVKSLPISSEAEAETGNVPLMAASTITISEQLSDQSKNLDELKQEILKEMKSSTSTVQKTRSHSIQCSRPVPKPLTLQGEKAVDPDYPPTTARIAQSAMVSCQNRNLKGQPLITELFADSVVEPEKMTETTENKPAVKFAGKPVVKQEQIKFKKQTRKLVKSAKQKKPIAVEKKKVKPEITIKSTDKIPIVEEESQVNQDEKKLVLAGSDWIIKINPKTVQNDDLLLASFEDGTSTIPIVEDEDLPFCESPINMLEESQTTVMTALPENLEMNNIESTQAIEISPATMTNIDQSSRDFVPERLINQFHSHETTHNSSDIRNIYETVQDSIKKDTSLRFLQSHEDNEENHPTTSLINSAIHDSISSKEKTLPFRTSLTNSHTFNQTESDYFRGSPLRVVADSLNSQGSGTHYSNSSQEDHDVSHHWIGTDCDEIYRTARKGKRVGRGAYGTVWSYFTIDGRVIAVKEIELDQNSDSDSVRDDYQSVREEVNILRRLNHPYIVKFLGTCLEDSRMIKIFMEYLPNGTIENLLTSFGPFHNDTLKKYTFQIVQGVAYLHDNGVVHRDIKGKNIMLDTDGNIKLIDFGCAKRLKPNQNTHSMHQILRSMKGTANWMAPEVIAETGHGKKADIWSIGCTLCEMATGKPPWSSEHNHLAVLLIIANGTKPPADLPETCPKSAQDFFRSCLTRDPAVRPSARDLLAHPFLT